MKTYNVCWSGGIDSTFIVTQLSQLPVTIQPFYVKGQTFRLSEPQELAAISSIRELLLADSRTKAEILSPIIIEKDDVKLKDRELVQAHRRIYMRLLEEYKLKNGGKLPPAGSQQIYVDHAYISPQYLAFASLAKFLNTTLELGLLCEDFELYAILSNTSSKIVELDDVTGRKILYFGANTTDKDLYMIFKNFRFTIPGQNMYKTDVWKWYETNNYLEVRAKTNFCQAPLPMQGGGYEPCGICNACIGVIREGVLEPFTEAGLARYRDYEENHEKFPEKFRLKGFLNDA